MIAADFTSPWPLVLLAVGVVVVVALGALIVTGSARLTRRLTRGRLKERHDTGAAGAGQITGMLGLIERGKGEDLYPRDRDR